MGSFVANANSQDPSGEFRKSMKKFYDDIINEKLDERIKEQKEKTGLDYEVVGVDKTVTLNFELHAIDKDGNRVKDEDVTVKFSERGPNE